MDHMNIFLDSLMDYVNIFLDILMDHVNIFLDNLMDHVNERQECTEEWEMFQTKVKLKGEIVDSGRRRDTPPPEKNSKMCDTFFRKH